MAVSINPASPIIQINLKQTIIPKFLPVFKKIMMHDKTTFIFKGGRGSTKSSFIAICIVLLIINNPLAHAVCFRQVGNTIQRSIYAQITWAIYLLGVQDYFHIPKNYANPIIYKPTGQQIVFMGLDDPDKVKSIKLPFGYIAITWFEELDQFKGENELRKVSQSTKRGGKLFWDFRSFNPPISKNNWANVYADYADIHSTSSVVVSNSYLDVPREWLSDDFIEDAEELKLKNPRAYDHEYMGIATGTGGDVFPNVKEFNARERMPIYDAYGNVISSEMRYKSFDHIYCGIDWGFALDPFRFVRMHFDNRRYELYIFGEYSAIQKTNKQVFDDLYGKYKLIKKTELVTADSAEPKSIMDFKNWGAYIRGANKGADSVRYGIKWLQGLNAIYIDRVLCPESWKEFTGYEYEQDRDGNFISAYPDENNHSIDSCVSYDTEIMTPDGNVRICDMPESGLVYSYNTQTHEAEVTEYIHCRMTYEDAEIWEIETEDGRIIECTGDHKILTSNRGYVRADKLDYDDSIVCINNDIAIQNIQHTSRSVPVYDMEVPKNHNFVLANGVVVHNCRYGTESFWRKRGQ